MKRKIIGLFVILAVLVAATTTGCKKEDPVKFTSASNINAKVVNDDDGQDVSSYVDSVYAVVVGRGGMEMVISPIMDKSKAPSRAIISGNTFIAGRAKYANGGFSMQLSDVPRKYLRTIMDIFNSDKLTISDKDALYVEASFRGIKNGRLSGEFILENLKASGERVAQYWYVNTDVNISGTIREEDAFDGGIYNYTDIFDLKLKKGWNIVLLEAFWGLEEGVTKCTSANNLNDYLWYYRIPS